jgi:hypothetical protein
VSGGWTNVASGIQSSVSGGGSDTASGYISSASGGTGCDTGNGGGVGKWAVGIQTGGCNSTLHN